MQFSFDLDRRTQTLRNIDAALRDYFTLPTVTRRFDPVTQLVKGLLGSRTKSNVSARALMDLQAHFGQWDVVRDQPIEEIYDVIRSVTFAENKAVQLKATLGLITDRAGRVSLDHLKGCSTIDTMAALERLPGVGRKVSASVLNASTWQRRALVIDTHHLRILRRLGLLSHRDDIARAYDRIMPDIPTEWTAEQIDDHHRLFKRLGQKICRYDRPLCTLCPLRTLCPFAGDGGGGEDMRRHQAIDPLP